MPILIASPVTGTSDAAGASVAGASVAASVGASVAAGAGAVVAGAPQAVISMVITTMLISKYPTFDFIFSPLHKLVRPNSQSHC
jgi:hypothetical protein